jgi:hypothetical protein
MKFGEVKVVNGISPSGVVYCIVPKCRPSIVRGSHTDYPVLTHDWRGVGVIALNERFIP